jgi:hypothetical protein
MPPNCEACSNSTLEDDLQSCCVMLECERKTARSCKACGAPRCLFVRIDEKCWVDQCAETDAECLVPEEWELPENRREAG